MKKNLRVIQINGFRGLFLTIFIISCLIAGFIAFPALMTMHAWNYLALKTGSFATINFCAGILLWGIIVLSIFIFNKKKLIVSFKAQQELTEDEVKDVLSKIKTQNINPCILMPKDLNPSNKDEKNLDEVSPSSKDN